MRPEVWNPPIELSAQEEIIVKRIRTRQIICIFKANTS